MRCPKCETGEIVLVLLKIDGELAHLCDYCETLWLTQENITAQTGHDLEAYKDAGVEYVINDSLTEETEDTDQGHPSSRDLTYP